MCQFFLLLNSAGLLIVYFLTQKWKTEERKLQPKMLTVRLILQSKNLSLVWQMILVALSCRVVLWSHSVLMFFVEIVSSAECADIWYKLKKEDKEKHIHVMKVYLLSPFLFGIVHQDDKVNKFIPMKIHCKISLVSIHFHEE